MAMITLFEMYNYNNKLFDGLTLPKGIDKDTLVDNILLQGGEFESLYINPDFLKNAIGVWSKKWNRTFEKWINALNIEYNPLENYDRYEDYTDKSDGTVNAESTATSNTNGISTSNVDNRVSAYDSDDYQPHNATSSNDNSDTNSTDKSNGISISSGTLKHTARLHGNIGVTTSQQMLQSELDIAQWNVYEHITDLFLREFVLLVY